MSRPFPYTFISCPCAQQTRSSKLPKRNSRELSPKKQSSPRKPTLNKQPTEDSDLESDDDDEESEQTFNPRSDRANFSLYPPEQLLYCEDCHQIKCPRCITEEIVCWYCPNCLFETPSSMVRSEGNRYVTRKKDQLII